VFDTGRGHIAIDWELATTRSALFDLHDMLFRRWCDGPVSDDLRQDIERGLTSLKEQLASSARASAALLSVFEAADVYRHIYYLERIHSFVAREKTSPRHLDRVLVHVDAFRRHESGGR
jgi:hypothetical protein